MGDLADEGAAALGKGADVVGNTVTNTANTATALATGNQTTNTPEKSVDLTESQKILTDKILANTELKKDISIYAESQKKTS